uniref:At1g61320/AtMIF1 LRR domain-containing protein n=1 Tax=Leersia perrieri TaxID=77586 RepID=A0A0D9XFI9_9ORYZ
MGYMLLKRVMALQRERRRSLLHRERRRRRQALAPGVADDDESISSVEKRKGSSYQQDDNPHSGKMMKYSGPDLPEEIWQHIHSFMPMRDTACAACLSSAFLYSWRNRSQLSFSIETMGIVESTTDFIRRIDHIMNKHSGIGLKALTIEFRSFFSAKARSYLERWLQIAVTPKTEEVSLVMSSVKGKVCYDFPCTLLSDGSGSSIRVLDLYCCSFHPTAELGCFQSLTRLNLQNVRITGDELVCVLSTSFALERLKLGSCHQIEHMKIPSVLQQLTYVDVHACWRLRVIENKAPNLHTLHISGQDYHHPLQLSFGESSLVKNLTMGFSFVRYHACTELPSIFPNLESLTIRLIGSTSMVSNTFLHLKHLRITLFALTPSFPSYDYSSLVSFFDACPSLDTFIMDVRAKHPKDDSIFVNPSDLWHLPEHRHDNLQNVRILGFCSAKSLVDLTYHIIKNTSVECLTLDTSNLFRCSSGKIRRCFRMSEDDLVESSKALLAIRTYIEGEVPSTVKLNVVEPCSRCYVIEPFTVK